MIYGLGTDPVYSNAIMNVKAIQSGVAPYGLISVEPIVKGNSEAWKLQEFCAAVGDDFCSENLVLDSGGSSVRTGATSSMELSPSSIANVYMGSIYAMAVGVDAPLHEAPFELSLQVNNWRFTKFHGVFKKPTDSLLYLPIIGSMIDGDKLSTTERQQWVEEMKKFPKVIFDSYSGWAMGLRLGKGVAVEGLAALWPWSMGIDSLHLLGTADLSLICLCVYLSNRKVYRRLSFDATNFSIRAISNGHFYRFKNKLPVIFSLKGRDDQTKADRIARQLTDCRGFDGGPCGVCAYMQSKFGKSATQLFWDYREAKAANLPESTMEISQFKEWLVTHSIAVCERFIRELKSRVHDRDSYFRFLEKIGEFAVIDAIEEVIDRALADGPKAYAQQVTRINNRKVYEKPRGRTKRRKKLLIQPRVHIVS